jgi:hypothetical protein
MSQRLRHLRALKLLDITSQILGLRVFIPLHTLFQIAYLVVLGPCLKTYFFSRHRCVRDAVLRHSVRSWGQFHVLLSDVDVTLVIKEESSTEELKRLRADIEKLRACLLFLGEFEIYTHDEFYELGCIEMELGVVLKVINWVRKLSWITPDISLPYHSYKAQRSRTRLLKQLKIAFAGRFTEKLQSLIGNANSDFASDSETQAEALGYLRTYGALEAFPDLKTVLWCLPGVNTQWSDKEVGTNIYKSWMRSRFHRYEFLRACAKSRTDTENAKDLLAWASRMQEEEASLKEAARLKGDLKVFDVHGTRFQIWKMDQPDLNHLAADIESEWRFFFLHAPIPIEKSMQISIRLYPSAWQSNKTADRRQVKTHLGLVSSSLGERKLVFANQQILFFQTSRQFRSVRVYQNNSSADYIINFIHSSVGELMERNGFVRLHALGVSIGRLTKVYLAPQGAGKSYAAVRLLKAQNTFLLGDETVFEKAGHLFSYPVPIASCEKAASAPLLRQRNFLSKRKFLVEIPADRVSHALPLDRVKYVSTWPRPLSLLTWLIETTLGLGLPQMKEYVIRKDTVLVLPAIAFQRFCFAIRALREKRVDFISIKEFRETVCSPDLESGMLSQRRAPT